MRKPTWFALTLVALKLLLSPTDALADWRDFIYADDGFGISFPAKPEETSKVVDAPIGTADVHFYMAGHTYMAAVSKFSNTLDIQTSIVGARQRALDAIKARATDERSVSLDGVSGTDFGFASDGYFGHARIYVTAKTLYQIVVIWGSNEPPADYQRFINSFHFVTN